jgi:hypothetical protein
MFMADHSQAEALSGSWSMKPVPDRENRPYRYALKRAEFLRCGLFDVSKEIILVTGWRIFAGVLQVSPSS